MINTDTCVRQSPYYGYTVHRKDDMYFIQNTVNYIKVYGYLLMYLYFEINTLLNTSTPSNIPIENVFVKCADIGALYEHIFYSTLDCLRVL